MKNPARLLNWSHLSPQARASLLQRAEAELQAYINDAEAIIDAVRKDGDKALIQLAQKLDRATIKNLRVSQQEIETAYHQAKPELKNSIQFAANNIRTFHQKQMPEPFWLYEVQNGAFAGERSVPLNTVACYVPRGKGAFPSVFLMTTIPARVAGVERIVVLTPPGPDGQPDHATLVAAYEVGHEVGREVGREGANIELYLSGGAQAVAAVAFGTESIPKCEKIVGPGSPWVGAAKQLLAQHIATATPAGPSEAIIFNDGTVSGKIAAMDLLVEAEHGPDSSAYLVTTSQEVAEQAYQTLPELWGEMTEERVRFSQTVLGGDNGGILVVPNLKTAYDFINDYAPEHLEVLSQDPFSHLSALRNAGEILLGQHTPVPLGNFVLGPNAVLPTGGAARYASPLSVHDYLKRIGVGYVTPSAYPELAKHAEYLARYEGFSAHANAVSSMREDIVRRDKK
ncbi:MAG: histidinol dehydrogenase [Alphaproteobacteria bacterium]